MQGVQRGRGSTEPARRPSPLGDSVPSPASSTSPWGWPGSAEVWTGGRRTDRQSAPAGGDVRAALPEAPGPALGLFPPGTGADRKCHRAGAGWRRGQVSPLCPGTAPGRCRCSCGGTGRPEWLAQTVTRWARQDGWISSMLDEKLVTTKAASLRPSQSRGAAQGVPLGPPCRGRFGPAVLGAGPGSDGRLLA